MPPTQIEKNFVVFCSPGTFVPETTELAIDSWDVEAAMRMARGITERYDARPFGFYFTTRGRGPKDLDSRELRKSNFYYLGGKVIPVKEVFERNLPDEEIMRDNLRRSGAERIIENTNSWKFTSILRETDVVLDFNMEPKDGGTQLA